ncbi:hypothetical protein [Halomarina ordinaria]|uniref:Uncharacterized protein n=1 Tax=Halomarina ordinaria TaxID=3033939 RepID=A0ABD5U6V7_9EURY|nr:hypothetical protein [Halomarina sp. PSRA2]
MDTGRTAVSVAVVAIVATLVLTGPYGPVDATTAAADGFGSDGGEASVAAVSLPDDATLTAGRYGAEAYTLRVPPATADVERVTGRPMLVYEVRVPALGYSRVSLASLDEGGEDVRLTLASDTFAPERIDRETYDGEVLVTVRSGEESRVVERAPLTVRVVE